MLTGLVSYYKFDSSNSNDSVSSNNGTDTSITYSSGNGKISVGAGFNGSTSKINLQSPSAFDDLQEFTFSCWINPTNFSKEVMPFSKLNKFLRLRNGADSGKMDAAVVYSTTNASVTTTAVLTGAAWNHVVLTYSVSGDRKIHMYVNGTECSYSTANTASVGTITTEASNNLYLGSYDGSLFMYLGAMDEVGIWSRALTSTEITSLYASGSGLQYPF